MSNRAAEAQTPRTGSSSKNHKGDADRSDDSPAAHLRAEAMPPIIDHKVDDDHIDPQQRRKPSARRTTATSVQRTGEPTPTRGLSRSERVRSHLEKLVRRLPHYRLSSSLISAYDLPEDINNSAGGLLNGDEKVGQTSSFYSGDGARPHPAPGMRAGEKYAPVTVARVLGMGSSGLVLYAERPRQEGGAGDVGLSGTFASNNHNAGWGSAVGATGASLPFSGEAGAEPQRSLSSSTSSAFCNHSASSTSASQQQNNISSTLRRKREGFVGFAAKFIDLEPTEQGRCSFTVKHAIREIETLRSCDLFSIMRLFNYFFIYSDGTIVTDVGEVEDGLSAPVGTGSVDNISSKRPPRRITSILIEVEYLNNGDLRGEIRKRGEAVKREVDRLAATGRRGVNAKGAGILTDPLDVAFTPAAPQALNDCFFSKKDLTLIMFQVLTGICHLHERQRIMHRDLKSENILLNGDGTVKIGDFGFSKRIDGADSRVASRRSSRHTSARALTVCDETTESDGDDSSSTASFGRVVAAGSNHTNHTSASTATNGPMRAVPALTAGAGTAPRRPIPPPLVESPTDRERQQRVNFARARTNSFCGTPLYMAPEIWRRDPDYGSKIDLFSLGVILYEMITLQQPSSVEKSEATTSVVSRRSHSRRSSTPRREKARERCVVVTPEAAAFTVRVYGQEYLDLLMLLLQRNPRKRPSALEVLARFPVFRVGSAVLMGYLQKRKDAKWRVAAAAAGLTTSASMSLPLPQPNAGEEASAVMQQLHSMHADIVAYAAERWREQQRTTSAFAAFPLTAEYFASYNRTSPPTSQAVESHQTTDAGRSKSESEAPCDKKDEVAKRLRSVVVEGTVLKLNEGKGKWRPRDMMLVQLGPTSFEIRMGLDRAGVADGSGKYVKQDFNDFVDVYALTGSAGGGCVDAQGKTGDGAELSSSIHDAPTSRFLKRAALMPALAPGRLALVTAPTATRSALRRGLGDGQATDASATTHIIALLSRTGTHLYFTVETEAQRDEWISGCLAVRDYLNKVQSPHHRNVRSAVNESIRCPVPPTPPRLAGPTTPTAITTKTPAASATSNAAARPQQTNSPSINFPTPTHSSSSSAPRRSWTKQPLETAATAEQSTGGTISFSTNAPTSQQSSSDGTIISAPQTWVGAGNSVLWGEDSTCVNVHTSTGGATGGSCVPAGATPRRANAQSAVPTPPSCDPERYVRLPQLPKPMFPRLGSPMATGRGMPEKGPRSSRARLSGTTLTTPRGDSEPLLQRSGRTAATSMTFPRHSLDSALSAHQCSSTGPRLPRSNNAGPLLASASLSTYGRPLYGNGSGIDVLDHSDSHLCAEAVRDDRVGSVSKN